MAFADPQKVKIEAVETTLPRVETGKNESSYSSSDSLIKLSASSQYGARTRRVIRLDTSKVTADPFIPANNVKVGMSSYLVFDIPNVGYTNAQAKAVYDGFIEALQTGSSKLITQLLGGES